jgi:hypothetical protein
MLRHLASAAIALFLALGAAHAQQGATADPTGPKASVDLLLDVIEDDQARAELIERLRASGAASVAASDALTDGTAPPGDTSFGRRIAVITQQAAEDVVDWGTRLRAQLARAPEVFDGLSGGEAGVLLDALRELALVIAGTVVVFFVLRGLGRLANSGRSASGRRSISTPSCWWRWPRWRCGWCCRPRRPRFGPCRSATGRRPTCHRGST